MQGTVLALALRPAKGQAVVVQQTLELSPEEGVVGDHGQSRRRQVTLLDQAAWNTACEEVGVELDWTIRRSNMLVQDLNLPALLNQQIRVGTALLKVIGEVTPCHFMDTAQVGLEAALAPNWRGGVYAKVIERGTVSCGDAVNR